MKALLSGDPMITSELFEAGFNKHLKKYFKDVKTGDWETDWTKLQDRRLKVEQQGPEIEIVPDIVLKEGKDAELLAGLFIPVSSKLFDEMPNLKIVGLARAGKENINLAEATKRGILAFNIMGRNAEAVSDFAVGLMLAESRNIARSYHSMRHGGWQKEFSNVDFVPQLKGKTVGIAGFGYIGRLVAKKLSGWDLNVIVYEEYMPKEAIEALGYQKVDKETLFRESDFITIHLRMVEATKKWADRKHLEMMKPTAYLINTGRSGLIDMDALADLLSKKIIAGAGLDVFDLEPLPTDSIWRKLENVTTTTHIAGTTTEVLTKSPYLLFEDIEKLFNGGKPEFILNPEVLEQEAFAAWLKKVVSL
jgi:D-3-phosphoglycerate dehydrogenase / 2-oxoglutarate reductase